MKDIQNSRDIDNRNFKSRIEGMDGEIHNNNNRIAHLNEVREQKDIDIGSVNQRIQKEA